MDPTGDPGGNYPLNLFLFIFLLFSIFFVRECRCYRLGDLSLETTFFVFLGGVRLRDEPGIRMLL